MVTLIERQFTVAAPLSRAWEHLACVEQWPSWATHIKRLELNPPGDLGPQSTGVLPTPNSQARLSSSPPKASLSARFR